MPECKTCGNDYHQGGSDPTLLPDECKDCELERLRAEAESIPTHDPKTVEAIAAFLEDPSGKRWRLNLHSAGREFATVIREKFLP